MRSDYPEAAYVDPRATLIGNVRIGAGSSVWPGAVLVGDCNPISIGRYTNIQENAVVHVAATPTTIGDYVCVAHAAVVHGAEIGDEVMVGVHATVLDGARIGAGSVIAAGAVVRENTVVPPNSLLVGVPAQIREGKGGAEATRATAQYYFEAALRFADGRETFTIAEIFESIRRRG